METRLAARGELPEEGVGTVRAERVHEGHCADVAVGAGEGAAVQVTGASGERERAVDDADRGLADVELGALGFRE